MARIQPVSILDGGAVEKRRHVPAEAAIVERAAVSNPGFHLRILEPSQVHLEPRKVLLVFAVSKRDLIHTGKSGNEIWIGDDPVIECGQRVE